MWENRVSDEIARRDLCDTASDGGCRWPSVFS